MKPLVRKHLLEIFQAGIKAVDGHHLVRGYLHRYPPDAPLHVVAIGKAAGAMMEGAVEALGDRLAGGLVITKPGHLPRRRANIGYRESGHPVPDHESLLAGDALLEFLDRHAGGANWLFLVSGGASSLVEVLPDSMGLADLRRINAWLLASGLEISTMNRVRQAVSCIKGGRLAGRLRGDRALVLLISDVPGDRPESIGSGLLAADARDGATQVAVPDWVERFTGLAPAAPTAGDDCFAAINHVVVGCLDDALQAAARHADHLGYPVRVVPGRLEGDALVAGDACARQLREGPVGISIWGGETTMALPASPGRGGRNQSLALSAAARIAGDRCLALLAAGTDGTDGPTEDAGGLVDGGTWSRCRDEGLDPDACLRNADAGNCLEASGDLVHTGPTGTNVTDLVIGVRLSETES